MLMILETVFDCREYPENPYKKIVRTLYSSRIDSNDSACQKKKIQKEGNDKNYKETAMSA